MNGKFFVLDPACYDPDTAIPSINGKYLSHYNDTWVVSKEPERSAKYDDTTGYGAVDEFEVLLDLQADTADGNIIGAWLEIPEKPDLETIEDYKIVDINVIGSFVDYVVQYKTNESSGNMIRYKYYRDRNVDGLFTTADYSLPMPIYDKSIIGSYNNNETYIKQFNNSVMLYPNLRMVINGNAVVAYSYAVLPTRIGTILVPFGDLLEDYLPYISTTDNFKTYIISKTSTGYIRIIRLGTDIPNPIERIAQYVHKINTVDVINILVERETRITAEFGSLDWNNKFEIQQNNLELELVAPDMYTYHVNSGYNPLYSITGLRSSSMIISDTTFTLYGFLFNQARNDGFNLVFLNASMVPNSSIDIFYDSVQPSKYKYSIINGIQRHNTLFADQSFPLGVMVPFPIGTKWSMQNEVKAVGVMSIGLIATGLTEDNKTMDLYLYSNQVYFGQDSFVLFGVQYVFDGDFIYQDSEQIAMAFGYKFLGCDNSSAYFYSLWDKSIYTFTGARTLTKVLDITNKSEVKVGRYDGFSGEMILLTQDEILKKRDNVIMNFPYVPADIIIPTKHGGYVQLADGRRILLSPLGDDIDALEVITEFIGVDGSTVNDYERIDVRLHSPDKKPLSFMAEIQTINQDTKQSEQKKIELKANEWSLDGYKTIKLIPQYKKGTGLSLRIYSENKIFITGIEFTYEPMARTANSLRTGH